MGNKEPVPESVRLAWARARPGNSWPARIALTYGLWLAAAILANVHWLIRVVAYAFPVLSMCSLYFVCRRKTSRSMFLSLYYTNEHLPVWGDILCYGLILGIIGPLLYREQNPVRAKVAPGYFCASVPRRFHLYRRRCLQHLGYEVTAWAGLHTLSKPCAGGKLGSFGRADIQ
jgi:hypothetical protein